MARPMSDKTRPEIDSIVFQVRTLSESASSLLRNSVFTGSIINKDTVRKLGLAYVELQTAAQTLFQLVDQESIEYARQTVEREFRIRTI